MRLPTVRSFVDQYYWNDPRRWRYAAKPRRWPMPVRIIIVIAWANVIYIAFLIGGAMSIAIQAMLTGSPGPAP